MIPNSKKGKRWENDFFARWRLCIFIFYILSMVWLNQTMFKTVWALPFSFSFILLWERKREMHTNKNDEKLSPKMWTNNKKCIQRKYTWNSILFSLSLINSEKHTHTHAETQTYSLNLSLFRGFSFFFFFIYVHFQFYRIDTGFFFFFFRFFSSFSSFRLDVIYTNITHWVYGNVVRKSNIRFNRNSISLSVENVNVYICLTSFDSVFPFKSPVKRWYGCLFASIQS